MNYENLSLNSFVEEHMEKKYMKKVIESIKGNRIRPQNCQKDFNHSYQYRRRIAVKSYSTLVT